MRYNKLVRDNIPAIIKKKGGTAVTRIAGKKEYIHKLREKLCEEVIEYIASQDTEELADILEVVEALALDRKVSLKKLLSVKEKKRRARGGFKKRIILIES